MPEDDASGNEPPSTATNDTASNDTASNDTASNDTASNDTASNATASNDLQRCVNCGAVLAGKFCMECGQEGSERKLRPLHHLALQMLDELLSLDSRAWRTLKALPHPGRLTRAYLGGRRAGYVPPLRLFILSGFLLLALMSLGRATVQTGPNAQVGINVDFDSTEQARINQQIEDAKAESGAWSPVEVGVYQILLDASDKSNEEMNRVFFNRLSVLAFLLFPLFALLMKGFYPRRLYAEHLVFALHAHTIGFLVGAGVFTLGLIASLLGVAVESVAPGLAGGGMLVVLGYVMVALHRVYPAPVWLTMLKGLVLLFVYLNAFGFVFLAYSVAAMALA